MSILSFSQYLEHQTIAETIEVLDEMLYLLVLNTYTGYSEDLTHQYITIRELRNVFIHFRTIEVNVVDTWEAPARSYDLTWRSCGT
ncbi:MAG: hypothetical protein AAGA66_02810 [Bacteroidota bacterium]